METVNTSMMMDGVVHMGDLMNLQVDPDAATVDSQRSMPYSINLSGKEAEPMTIDTLQRIDIVQPQGYQPEYINQDLDHNNNTYFPPYETLKRAAQTTRTASKSVPSLSPGSSGSLESPPTKHTRPKTTKKQDSKTARKKQKTSKLAIANVSDDEDDSKRNQYLKRNKVAASKCRQKKKVWVNDLEAQKSELEHKHSNLQNENKCLVNEVTQLKNQLMAHASCGDPRINGWIEIEAKRFVQRTTDGEQGSMSVWQQRSPPSSSEFIVEQPPSPTMPNGPFLQPPLENEEINYDNMPDDMF